MSDRSAYDHDARLAGQEPADDAVTEHRDTARGDAGERNELAPSERNQPDREQDERRGPTTHDDTRFSRKAGE